MLNNWKITSECLEKEFVFNDFESAIAWMHGMVPIISAIDHHPEWCNIYNRIKVKLTTHSAGNKVTALDYQLASALDQAYIG